MNSFRTEIEVKENSYKIEYDTKVMFLGSCFATNIGQKFKESKLQAMVNPFGVIYNPVSVANTLRSIIQNKQYTESEIHFKNDHWHSFHHHSSFSHQSKDSCLQNINTNNQKAHNYLKETKFLFITFGTAWVYQWIENNQIVSNCHKYPAKVFNRFMLNPNEIINTYKKLLTELLVFNPQIKIIFTVSPVRHWKDGAHGNQLSKSTLLLAIDSLVEMFESSDYFPAYEIMLDDLRDYRFYDDDMLHPNRLAIEYIWNKFELCYFSKNTLQYQKEMIKLVKAINHRPFDSTSESHQKFLRDQIDKVKSHKINYPKTDFSEEIRFLKSKMV
ncbi:GSCFA domain protein [Labilibacter sediminis]|nr:GSCFA domain protein [Labilibacter sediminis]